mgnify:CR=1 FL=1
MILIAAGPIITAIRTGRKNRIIGTVSFGGSAAAFFSDVNLLQARVRGALAETPFGAFLVPGVPDGTEVDIVIRPQHIRIDFDRDGKGPAPTPEQGTRGSLGLAGMAGTIKSEELAKSVSSGIHKCVDLGQEAAAQLARRIQAQIGKAQSESANKPGS